MNKNVHACYVDLSTMSEEPILYHIIKTDARESPVITRQLPIPLKTCAQWMVALREISLEKAYFNLYPSEYYMEMLLNDVPTFKLEITGGNYREVKSLIEELKDRLKEQKHKDWPQTTFKKQQGNILLMIPNDSWSIRVSPSLARVFALDVVSTGEEDLQEDYTLLDYHENGWELICDLQRDFRRLFLTSSLAQQQYFNSEMKQILASFPSPPEDQLFLWYTFSRPNFVKMQHTPGALDQIELNLEDELGRKLEGFSGHAYFLIEFRLSNPI